MLHVGTHTLIVVAIEYKLSIVLDLPDIPTISKKSTSYSSIPSCIITAFHHQNLIGWDNFLCGYTSTYWAHAFSHLCDLRYSTTKKGWGKKTLEKCNQSLKRHMGRTEHFPSWHEKV